MKKYFILLLILVTVITSCSDKNTSDVASSDNIDLISTEGIDVDLTLLSSIMVYSEVYNMVFKPDDYLGKVIKINGIYYSSYYEETDLYYHFVIIDDATACCQSGIEFIWSGEQKFPDDYPADGAEIEIVGVYGSYDELDYTYFYLAVDDIVVIG